MLGKLSRQRGISLFLVTLYSFVAFVLIGSLLNLLQNRLIQDKQEAAVVQARGLAEAGLSKALAAYPEEENKAWEPWGNGFYGYQVNSFTSEQIQVISWGSLHKGHSRLSAIRCISNWKVIPGNKKTTYQLLVYKEERVPLKNLLRSRLHELKWHGLPVHESRAGSPGHLLGPTFIFPITSLVFLCIQFY